MNDFQMNHLALERQHDFQREAADHRLARVATRRHLREAARPGTTGPRSTLRLTLDYVLGRTAP